MASEREDRVANANRFLEAIASDGRKFFALEGRVSRFELDHRGRVWFVDKWKGGRIYTHTKPWARWRHFTEGGTLRRLVEALREYIMGRAPLPVAHVAPARTWTDGDIWGYGAEAASTVRAKCEALAPVPPTPEEGE